MKLRKVKTNEYRIARIEQIENEDWKWIEASEEFSFDWTTEESYEIFKVVQAEMTPRILGLMSVIDRPEEYRIHLNLLEVGKSNRGKNKKLHGIAGCLIGFAAGLAFKRGYFGFVSLEPKTVLINHYQQKYGFRQYGRYLGIEGDASRQLIETYLEDE